MPSQKPPSDGCSPEEKVALKRKSVTDDDVTVGQWLLVFFNAPYFENDQIVRGTRRSIQRLQLLGGVNNRRMFNGVWSDLNTAVSRVMTIRLRQLT